jgi:hypothetical protein
LIWAIVGAAVAGAVVGAAVAGAVVGAWVAGAVVGVAAVPQALSSMRATTKTVRSEYVFFINSSPLYLYGNELKGKRWEFASRMYKLRLFPPPPIECPL